MIAALLPVWPTLAALVASACAAVVVDECFARWRHRR